LELIGSSNPKRVSLASYGRPCGFFYCSDEAEVNAISKAEDWAAIEGPTARRMLFPPDPHRRKFTPTPELV